MDKRGFVISDLHLFARRSVGHTYLEQIAAAAKGADLFILNGDIFDFRWSRYPSFKQTSDEALIWMRALAERAPNCQFFFLPGNHDAWPELLTSFQGLSKEVPNLSVYNPYLRLGPHLFLHGDIHYFGMDPVALTKWREMAHPELRPRGRIANLGYDAILLAKAHKLPGLLLSRRKMADRIIDFLGRSAEQEIKGVEHIYFGHTHTPFADFKYRDFTFHNTGSAIKASRFNMLPFTVPADLLKK